jgi:2,4-dienoyl-CoA reductase-like NADH-dependent reductase (Old Yellow Enzyme family)
MASLFDPFVLKGVTLKNRIAVSPMCQYSAVDGVVNDWHYGHLAGLARGGSSLVIVEATGVSPEGRITPGCVGLWNDQQAEALARAVRLIKNSGGVPGIQIAHSGRKGSANRPWEGDDHIPESDPRAWQPIAPSAIAYGGGLNRIPKEMTVSDIHQVTADFVAAAKRALSIGFEWLELHFAHGYLGQNFLSPHSNLRQDQYGGSLANRSRFLNETLSSVRDIWPESLPLTARMGVIEYDDRSETLDESISVIREFKARGLDLIDVSVGFSTPEAEIPFGPNFMASVAAQVRREAGLPTATSWYISEPEDADAMIRDGQVDLVMLARALLENHHWPYAAARALQRDRPSWTLPPPYAHWLERYRSATPSFR